MIDAWLQHPTLRHSQDPIFDSLRRWTKSSAEAISVSDSGNVLDAARTGRLLKTPRA